MKVLTFFAHPDDETVFNGGAMALLAQAGVEVHFLSATRGEGGETGNPPICTLDALGEHRSSELACAVEALGGSSLSFLGYVDPRVGPDEALYSFTEDMDQLKARLADRLLDLEVDVLVTHGSNGEYGHPAHRTCHQAAQMAVNSINGPRRPLFYTFAPFFSDHPYPRLTNQDDTADLILDIRPALAQKTAAILCHQTQHNLFVRKRSEHAGRRLAVEEVVIEVESLHRAASGPAEKQTAFENLLASHLVREAGPG